MNKHQLSESTTDPLLLLRQEIAKLEAQHNNFLTRNPKQNQEAQLLLLRKAILSKHMELIRLRMEKEKEQGNH